MFWGFPLAREVEIAATIIRFVVIVVTMGEVMVATRVVVIMVTMKVLKIVTKIMNDSGIHKELS